jgi:hypothetical protein
MKFSLIQSIVIIVMSITLFKLIREEYNKNKQVIEI